MSREGAFSAGLGKALCYHLCNLPACLEKEQHLSWGQKSSVFIH